MTIIEVTAIEQNHLLELEELLEETNRPFGDEDVEVIRAVGLDPHGAARAFLAEHSAPGFVEKLRNTLASGRDLTDRQVRATLNIFREKKLGLKRSTGFDATVDPDFDHNVKCRECGAGFDNLAVLVQHRMDEHDFVPAWGSEEQALVAPVPIITTEESSGLDLSSLPDGYYGVPLPNSYNSSPWTFFAVKRLRGNRPIHRNRRYRTGAVITGSEFVPAGTIEVREVSGSTERLSGEQRGHQLPDELYRGEFTEHLEMVLTNPEVYAKLFATMVERCGRCGKRLTDDISRSDCFGPECINKVSDHYYSSWSGRYTEEAKVTCPYTGCRRKDGKPVEDEADTFECSKGHRWHFAVRNRKVTAGV